MKKFIFRLIVFLLYGFILILTIDSVCRYIIKIPKKQNFLNVEKMDALFNKINEKSILVIGDSRLEWGIKPLVIDSALNQLFPRNKCINLAMINNSGLSTMEYLIKEKKYPLVLVFNFNIFNYQYNDFQFNCYSSASNRSRVALKNKIQEEVLKNSYILEPNFTSIKSYLKHDTSIYTKVIYDNSGGCYVYQRSDYDKKKKVQVDSYQKYLDDFNYNKFKKYLKTLNTYLDSFRRNGTTIVLLDMPICNELERIEDLDITKNESKTIYRDYEIDFSSYTYQNSIKENDFYFDGSHINLQNSYTFSYSVAKELITILKKHKL